MVQVIEKDDGGVIYVAERRRPRTGKRLIDTFAEHAQILKKTESGQVMAGLICPGFPWVYWSYREDHCGCERCGARHNTPTALDPVELAQRYLVPFSDAHKLCPRKESQ